MDEYDMESNVEFLDDETTCSVCYAEFLDINDLNLHINQIHLNEATMNRYCCACRSFFHNVEEYALHLRIYHLKRLQWCKYCTRVFFNKEDLKKHENKHGEWKYKSCSHCDKTFLFKDILAAHEYKNHRAYNDTSEGVMLQEIFPALSALLHMNAKKFFTVQYTHESYKCISCGLSTSDINKFLQHVESESKKPFVCNECCQVFVCKKKLRRHMKGKCKKIVEWSECEVCEKRIESKEFDTHSKQCVQRKYASDNKDATFPKTIPILTCKFCKKMFVGNIALDKHIDRTHKPNFHLYKYKCIECDMPFHHPKYLFTHYFTHHRKMQPYTCKICNKKYKVRKSFTLHIKLDHKSVGFVEFDEDYKVFFTDKKSEKPFQPYPVLPEYLANKQVINDKKTENCKIHISLENSDFINATETECETDIDRKEKNLFKHVENVEGETDCETDVDRRDENVAKPAERVEEETDCETDIDRGDKYVGKPAERVEEETDCETDIGRRDENVAKPAERVEEETDCETDIDRRDKYVGKPAEGLEEETDCETDVDGREKSVSKSAEILEGETECETDVDGNAENSLLVKTSAYIEVEIDCKKDYKAVSKCRKSKDESETNVDMTKKKVKNKRKSRTLRHKTEQNYNTEVSSNDSDVPLIEMTKRKMNFKKKNKKRKKNKFFCIKCNKNCYTYQNYNHHMSLHVGCKLKKCIKCEKIFKSKIALDEHMKKKHTSSKLIETLKQVRERRKNGAQVSTDPLILRENLKKTIHKVIIPEEEITPAVLKLVEDGLSAKSFIESFMPEDSSKEIKVTSSITIKETKGGYKAPLIKMTKFKHESPASSTKLRMPVKFKAENTSHVKAKIKIIQNPIHEAHKPQLALTTDPDENHDSTCQSYDSDNVFIDEKEEIPDVAEEVMLNTEEKEDVKEIKIMETQNSIVIPNFPENYGDVYNGDIKIAHLQPEAPFYKIVSMKDVMKTASENPQVTAQSSEPVTLPGGMKLVSVNPLAHLLGNTNVDKILKPNKHYNAKVGDIKSAMEKAMKNVYQPRRRRKIE